jgi:hypothetical protein
VPATRSSWLADCGYLSANAVTWSEDELLEALDAARAQRVEASYRATPVAGASGDDAAEATSELFARAEEFVG